MTNEYNVIRDDIETKDLGRHVVLDVIIPNRNRKHKNKVYDEVWTMSITNIKVVKYSSELNTQLPNINLRETLKKEAFLMFS